MRSLCQKEKEKRGCILCSNIIRMPPQRNYCPFDECPYHELDNHPHYKAYLKARKLDLSIEKILKMIEPKSL